MDVFSEEYAIHQAKLATWATINTRFRHEINETRISLQHGNVEAALRRLQQMENFLERSKPKP